MLTKFPYVVLVVPWCSPWQTEGISCPCWRVPTCGTWCNARFEPQCQMAGLGSRHHLSRICRNDKWNSDFNFCRILIYTTVTSRSDTIGIDFGGSRARALPIIEKCPCIYHLLAHFATQKFGFAHPISLPSLWEWSHLPITPPIHQNSQLKNECGNKETKKPDNNRVQSIHSFISQRYSFIQTLISYCTFKAYAKKKFTLMFISK